MKKTLITLAAFAVASVAQAAVVSTDTVYTFTGSVASIGEALTQDSSWTLTGSITLGSEKSGEWGTALVATGDAPTANSFPGGFQLFLNTNGAVHAKLNGSYDMTAITGVYATQVLTYTLTFDAEPTGDRNMFLTVTCGDTTYTDNAWVNGDFSITQLVTNTNEAIESGWSMGDVTVTREMEVTPAVPEPTTATLSLLALAGLAARRRRK